MLSFQMFLKKTWTGRAIRAVVQNPEAAAMMGIDGEKIVSIAYSLSYSLIGIAAIILMTMFQVEPTFGGKLQTYAFLICVAAGIGNISGALWDCAPLLCALGYGIAVSPLEKAAPCREGTQ